VRGQKKPGGHVGFVPRGSPTVTLSMRHVGASWALLVFGALDICES
jgi:hypothetical protein